MPAPQEAKPVAAPPPELVSKPAPPLKYGNLYVTSHPSGAKISIDGRTGPDWVTPYTLDSLTGGRHRLRLSAEGYASAIHTVRIEVGKTRSVDYTLAQLRAAPAPPRRVRQVPPPETEEPTTTPAPPVPAGPPKGVWRIVTVPPGSEVIIDGKSVGPSPVQKTLDAGKHTYAIKMNGVEVYNGDIDLPANQISITRVSLGP